MYVAAMDRIVRWVSGLKDHFERAAAKEAADSQGTPESGTTA